MEDRDTACPSGEATGMNETALTVETKGRRLRSRARQVRLTLSPDHGQGGVVACGGIKSALVDERAAPLFPALVRIFGRYDGLKLLLVCLGQVMLLGAAD